MGDIVKIRGTSRRAKIIEILDDPDLIEWKNNSPYFIIVKLLDADESFVCNAGQLRRKLS